MIIDGYVDAATLLSGAVAADRLQYRTEFSNRKKSRLSEVETNPRTVDKVLVTVNISALPHELSLQVILVAL